MWTEKLQERQMGAGCPVPLWNPAAIRGKFCTLNFRTLGENAGACLLFVPWEKSHPCKHLSLYLYSTTFIHGAPNLLIHTQMPEVILNVGSSPFYPWVCGIRFFKKVRYSLKQKAMTNLGSP